MHPAPQCPPQAGGSLLVCLEWGSGGQALTLGFLQRVLGLPGWGTCDTLRHQRWAEQ